MIIDVITEKRTSIDREIYSYRVPEELIDQIKIGSVIFVPFGKKIVRGVVLREATKIGNDSNYEVKEIKSVDPNLVIPKGYIRVAEWIARYYLCSLGEAVALFLPPALTRPRRGTERKVAPRELNELNLEQEMVYQKLKSNLAQPQKPALIFGVTASGKTEIYLKLAGDVIDSGKQVVVLVPEIILTPQIIERFEAVFGHQVALIHSDLSKSEKFLNYQDFYSGKKSIIIGPRSALLVPSQKLGLIIIDEEGDSSYKQEKNPKYNAARLAEEIARQNQAQLVMGSATPTVETFYRAARNGIELLELKSRYNRESFPPTEIIDLREEIKAGNYSPISESLKTAIGETLKFGRQVFLFLNRRGAATFVSCRECGEVILCPHCSVPLVYHLGGERPRRFSGSEVGRPHLSCHHCDYQTSTPYRCPVCLGYKIKYFGAGVEKIELEIAKLFPRARIKRVDSSSMTSKDSHRNIYHSLKNGEIDILIGTQIITRGFDIPAVDLVGVISADVGLHLPYFKAEERVFQLLTQVSGRSGRGEHLGKTVIQTYWPNSRAVLAAKGHDYKLFFDKEIVNRTEFGYPPLSHLVRVVAEDVSKDKAKAEIEAVALEAKKRNLEILGPAKAFFPRLHGKHRYHLIFKVEKLPDQKLTEIFKTNPYLFWDVDPENLL